MYLWSPWKEIMEGLCEDKNIKADCEVMEGYVASYTEPNEPIFTKMLHGFHISLGCRKPSGQGDVLHVRP